MAKCPDDTTEILMRIWESKGRENMQPLHMVFCSGVDLENMVRAQTKDFSIPLTDGQKDSLAFAYEQQGRYDEALPLMFGRRKEIVERLIEARDRDDYEFCQCQVMPVVQEKRWSTKHDKFVEILSCPQCQLINITPEQLKPELIKKYNAWVAANTTEKDATR